MKKRIEQKTIKVPSWELTKREKALIKIYCSYNDIAKDLKLSKSHVSNIVNGNRRIVSESVRKYFANLLKELKTIEIGIEEKEKENV